MHAWSGLTTATPYSVLRTRYLGPVAPCLLAMAILFLSAPALQAWPSCALVPLTKPINGPPCEKSARATLPRPPHSTPTSVTIAIRPSGGMECLRLYR